MKGLGSLSYVMTLSGPKTKRAPQLLGLFDPITNNPWLFVLGIGAGVFFGLRGGSASKRGR